MSRPNVTIERGNGQLGTVATSQDGTTLLVVSFDNTAHGVAALLTGNQLTDFEALGLSAAKDQLHGELVWEHVRDFYAQAPAGTILHVLAITPTTTLTNLFTPANAAYIALRNTLLSQAGAIKLIGVALNPTFVETTPTAGVQADVLTAVPLAQALADDEFELFRPVSFLLEGRMFTAATMSAASDLRALASASVSVTIARNRTRRLELAALSHPMAAKYAAVGTTVGRAAAIPVQRNIGRVKDGPIGWTDAELSGSQAISGLSEADLNTLDGKGYIFALRHSGLNGYYFNDDHTCVLITDDYAYLSRMRTIDKAARIARRVYLNELLDEVAVDPDTGRLAPIVVKTYELRMQTAIEDEMQAQGEIVSATVTVDPNQNVLATSRIEVLIQVVPYGVARAIVAKVQFLNPANG